MPSRNVIKIDVPDNFYHIYARGHGRHRVFRDAEDFRVFLNLFKRHLGAEPASDKSGRQYKHLSDSIELSCYCLMPNHFHLLIYQMTEGAMQQLMRSVMTAYGRYFNTKYETSGSVFESTYKAAMITSDAYLMHISRYIHLNPEDWREYQYSSLPFYLDAAPPDWVCPDRILELFSVGKYGEFVDDYQGYKRQLDFIKSELAGGYRAIL